MSMYYDTCSVRSNYRMLGTWKRNILPSLGGMVGQDFPEELMSE